MNFGASQLIPGVRLTNGVPWRTSVVSTGITAGCVRSVPEWGGWIWRRAWLVPGDLQRQTRWLVLSRPWRFPRGHAAASSGRDGVAVDVRQEQGGRGSITELPNRLWHGGTAGLADEVMAAEQGVEADEAWPTSELRSLTPVFGGLNGGAMPGDRLAVAAVGPSIAQGLPNTGVKLRSSEVDQASSASTPCSAAIISSAKPAVPPCQSRFGNP